MEEKMVEENRQKQKNKIRKQDQKTGVCCNVCGLPTYLDTLDAFFFNEGAA